MKKELPGVFPGNVRNNSGNNRVVSYLSENIDKESETREEKIDVSKKIKEIFNSSDYIYKADVEIELKNGKKIIERIIGKNKKYLITIKNELIPIDNIVNIKK